MTDLPSRLDGLRPTIEKNMALGGTPGISLGVIHKGNEIYYFSYDYRDTARGLPINDETVFPVCSLTKAITAAAMGILVEEKKATWETH